MICFIVYLQVNGIEDPIFPIAGAEDVHRRGRKIYEENGCGEHCVMIKGNDSHRFYADYAWPIVHKLMNIL